MRMSLVIPLALICAAPSLGNSQDTTRTGRKAAKLVVPRRDTVRFSNAKASWTFIRDSIRYAPRDSIRWIMPKDSVHWLPFVTQARRDSTRSEWIPQASARSYASESWTPTMALEHQNGNAVFAQHLFPPELVMQHQSRLKLTEQQRTAIVQEINRLQATAVNVQWRVADESEKLSELLSQDAVAEAAALEQVNKVIEYETAVKRAQLSMLIRIRNVLTPEQRTILRNLPKPAK